MQTKIMIAVLGLCGVLALGIVLFVFGGQAAEPQAKRVAYGSGVSGANMAGSGNAPAETGTPSSSETLVSLPLLSKANVTATPEMATATATATLPPSAITPTPMATATLPPGALAIVTLGDSLTEGDQDSEFDPQGRTLGYPGRLLPLVQALPGRSASVLTNIGKSGWSSNQLVSEGGPDGSGGTLTAQLPRAIGYLQSQIATGKAGVACVLIGSNDLWYLYNNPDDATPEQESADLANYSNNIEAILSQLRATGATVMIGLVDDQSLRPVAADPARRAVVIPDVSANELVLMSAQARRYNDVIRAKAAQHGAIIVDFFNTTIFTDPATIGDDGIHPNATGYAAMTALWMGAIR